MKRSSKLKFKKISSLLFSSFFLLPISFLYGSRTEISQAQNVSFNSSTYRTGTGPEEEAVLTYEILADQKTKTQGFAEDREWVSASVDRLTVRKKITPPKPVEFEMPEEIAPTERSIKEYAPPGALFLEGFPDEGRPRSFRGTTGKKFKMKTAIKQDKKDAYGKVTFWVLIQGKGNLQSIQFPEILFGKDWRVMQVSSEVYYEKGLENFSGGKLFRYELMPTRSGSVRIPSVEFSYFNLEKERYFKRSSKPHPLKATQLIEIK